MLNKCAWEAIPVADPTQVLKIVHRNGHSNYKKLSVRFIPPQTTQQLRPLIPAKIMRFSLALQATRQAALISTR